MPTIARNAPCPCGSGRKHKLCCGTTREQERAARRALATQKEAIQALFALPTLFPLLRPASSMFEHWLAAVPRDAEVTRELVEAGLAQLGDGECERIIRSHARRFPHAWATLVAEVGDEETALRSLLAGAVVAALSEDPRPDERILDLLEDDLDRGPAEALALCLDACDLWSVGEALAAEEAVARIPEHLDDDAYATHWDEVFARQAASLTTRQHRRRLTILVQRLRAQLPFDEFPDASARVERACATFGRDRRVRAQLAALLLEDTLEPLALLDLPVAA